MPIHFPFALHSLCECRNPEPPVGSGPLLPETCRIPFIFLPDAHPHFFWESYPLVDATFTITKHLLMGLGRLLDESKTDREHDVVVVRLQERMSLHLWLCLLYAAVPNPIPNPRSEPLVPQSPPSHCSSNVSEPIPFTPPQMVTSASPRQSLSCLIVIFVLHACILIV